ncbi:hypothetical protein AIOL_000970 [Candidatus Rhodobacter oscarellae]|uniref:Nucleotide diphosphatase n=1 Tax=Candidatus Rhodobacter oscarellae TaxID=1675527 RepID=A0A0J9EDL1_9RHOB|nr:alkaline phosphatase [Candidatus Rhodobacter lobularis]KMW60805.1 hypothetical protein AIOL_000970 [Candidatus Rhodobacter lobularis]
MLPATFFLVSFIASAVRLMRWAAVLGAILGLYLAVPLFAPRAAFEGPVGVQHVVLVGVDGLTARALGKGHTPTLDVLLADGAGTLAARAVMPTMSSANWASHLMGAGPERHGIRFNDWRPDWWDDVAMCGRGVGAGWPGIFEVIDAGHPYARSGVFYDWIGIGRFAPRAYVDRRAPAFWAERAARMGMRYYRRWRPALTFIHLDNVDAAGHAFGFDSAEYLQEAARADALIAQIKRRIDRASHGGRTLLMVVSDHGGIGKIHGRGSEEEILVPYILWGAGVASGETLGGAVSVTDTAPTIAWALGLDAPGCWTGAPLTSGFATR